MSEIAKPTKVNHKKLGKYQRNFTLSITVILLPARILRLLATNYIFTEVSPDVFANNRLSSVLDTGKPVEELLAKWVPSLLTYNDELRIFSPESKHIGTPGITSFIEHRYKLLVGLLQFYILMRSIALMRASRLPVI